MNELWASPAIALGANRLEIVDSTRGRQPATNEDGSILVVLNGEIYNHRELASELEGHDHKIRTTCDTEVIAHAYEEWGSDLFDHLRGMFAVIVHDRCSGRTLLARDPAGVKPLYFGRDRSGCVFAASEAKALVGLVDSAELLLPGHLIESGEAPRAYNTSITASCPSTFADAAEELANVLDVAVGIRIPPDLPFCIFLSGGLDSSLILALAARHRPDVIAITVGMRGSTEISRARELCTFLGVQHEVVEFSFEQLTANYDRVISHLESFEPNLVRASLVTYIMCQRARELGLRVAIAGEGADEQFAGYRDFEDMPPDRLTTTLAAFFSDLHRTQLMRWDKMGMAHTLEVRTPFMDRHVVDLAKKIPVSWKLRPQPRKGRPETKAVLRAAAEGILPEFIRTQEKIPMDEGVTPHGREEWERLLNGYFSALPTPQLSPSLISEFSLRSREEMINLSILTRYTPRGFVSKTRINVRGSLP